MCKVKILSIQKPSEPASDGFYDEINLSKNDKNILTNSLVGVSLNVTKEVPYMTRIPPQRLAKTLRFMVSALMVCNMVGFLLIPVIVVLSPEELLQSVLDKLLHLLGVKSLPAEQAELSVPLWWTMAVVIAGWQEVWTKTAWVLHALFLFACGGCTLVILRQAYDILDTILEGNPFQVVNAKCMKRAAFCCWGISAAALARLMAELYCLRTIAPLCTYNTLFIPVFLMAGLLFLVMSTLFGQAAQLQEDQDLTI